MTILKNKFEVTDMSPFFEGNLGETYIFKVFNNTFKSDFQPALATNSGAQLAHSDFKGNWQQEILISFGKTLQNCLVSRLTLSLYLVCFIGSPGTRGVCFLLSM